MPTWIANDGENKRNKKNILLHLVGLFPSSAMILLSTVNHQTAAAVCQSRPVKQSFPLQSRCQTLSMPQSKEQHLFTNDLSLHLIERLLIDFALRAYSRVNVTNEAVTATCVCC